MKTGMSLLNFGFSRNRTTNKRPHESDDSDCDSNNNGKDAKYDKKRIRDFQSHWRDDRPWLMYNEDTRTMYCTFCQSFPAVADKSNALTRGTANLENASITGLKILWEHLTLADIG